MNVTIDTQGINRRDALRTTAAAGVGLAAAAALARGHAMAAQEATPAAGGGATTRTVLTLDGALAAIEAARMKANELGVAMVIVVVDESGILKAFARMDGTGIGSIDLASGKAYTAAAFRTATKDLAERVAQDPARLAAFSNAPRVVLLPGGVPLKVGDDVVGGIGCGGGTPDQDAEVAQAGADAFAAM
jgi:uncharacterized protein GlcG (DUF336 family)